MTYNKMMAVDEEIMEFLRTKKVIPRESFGDCLKKILNEYKELKGKWW